MTDNIQNVDSSGLNTPKAIVIAGLIIAAGVYYGLSSGTVNKGNQIVTEPVTVVTVAPGDSADANADAIQTGKVAIGDDAVKGDPSATVAIVEFSDYECPFCQRHYKETLPQIEQDYIDAGTVQYIFKDLPLPFHEPLATEKAIAANCAYDQGGAESYYKYHDELFEAGAGAVDYAELAKKAGVGPVTLTNCVESEEFKEELSGDLIDANSIGASGTPTLLVGKVVDGIVEGEIVVGAIPYASLKPIIESYLE